MHINNICVLGGGGFVGRHVVHQLAARRHHVRVLTRQRERTKSLIVLPTVDVVETDIHPLGVLEEQFRGMDAVINLIGILHDRPGGPGGFQDVHVGLPRRVVAACNASGVRRLLHMSALAADPSGPSAYLRSKGEGEAVARGAGATPGGDEDGMRYSRGLEVTVFRPSVIFGRGDHFINLFAGLLRRLPVVPLGSPDARFQPVWVEDVAHAFVNSLSKPETFGKSYDLCGPQAYTLRELVEYVAGLLGEPRRIVPLGDRLSYWQAWVMEKLPGRLLTRDNYESMKIDNVCTGGFPPELGVEPAALEAIVPTYLGGGPNAPRQDGFRSARSQRG